MTSQTESPDSAAEIEALADTLDGVLGSLALILDRGGRTLAEIAHVACMGLVDADLASLTVIPVDVGVLQPIAMLNLMSAGRSAPISTNQLHHRRIGWR